MQPEPSRARQLPPHTSIGSPRFAPTHAREYERALDTLARDGVRVMVGGALALNAYTGIWRDTKDLDLFCAPEDVPRALAALARAGFETEVVYASWLAKGWRGDVFVDLIWRNANGLFSVTTDWFEHATSARILDRDVLMVPLEELLLSKMMVGSRDRFDGADMLHLFYAAGDRIDWERLARLAGEHVGLLLSYMHMYRWGYPGWEHRIPDEVVDRYHELARRAESQYGPFRALLLDMHSFRVDVEDWGMPDPHQQALADALRGDTEAPT